MGENPIFVGLPRAQLNQIVSKGSVMARLLFLHLHERAVPEWNGSQWVGRVETTYAGLAAAIGGENLAPGEEGLMTVKRLRSALICLVNILGNDCVKVVQRVGAAGGICLLITPIAEPASPKSIGRADSGADSRADLSPVKSKVETQVRADSGADSRADIEKRADSEADLSPVKPKAESQVRADSGADSRHVRTYNGSSSNNSISAREKIFDFWGLTKAQRLKFGDLPLSQVEALDRECRKAGVATAGFVFALREGFVPKETPASRARRVRKEIRERPRWRDEADRIHRAGMEPWNPLWWREDDERWEDPNAWVPALAEFGKAKSNDKLQDGQRREPRCGPGRGRYGR